MRRSNKDVVGMRIVAKVTNILEIVLNRRKEICDTCPTIKTVLYTDRDKVAQCLEQLASDIRENKETQIVGKSWKEQIQTGGLMLVHVLWLTMTYLMMLQ